MIRVQRLTVFIEVGEEVAVHIPALHLGSAQAQDLFSACVIQQHPPGVAHDHTFAHGGEQGAETVLAFAQFCLRIAAIRDVDAGPDVPRKLAPSVINGAARVDDPAVLAVTAAQAILHLKRSADGKMLQVGAHAAVEIVRVDAAGPAVAHLVL